MNRLPASTEQKLLAILRERGKPFDEHQACLDFAGILERLELLTREGNRPGIRRPWEPLRILAEEVAQTFHHHTGDVPGRTISGGRGARFLLLLAEAAGLTDPKTAKPYSLQKAASAIRETQRGLNSKAALNRLPKFSKGNEGEICNSDVEAMRDDAARDAARGEILEPHVIRYENEDGEPVIDPHDGYPVLEGYQPAPDRNRISGAQKAAAAKYLKTHKD